METTTTSNYASKYLNMQDEELLLIAADRIDLVEQAAIALDGELRTRGLGQPDVEEFKRMVQQSEARNTLGKIGLGHLGMGFAGWGKQFLGCSNYTSDPSSGFEEFDSILWMFVLFFPVAPRSAVRIRRRTKGNSIFWSFSRTRYSVLALKPLTLRPVAVTYFTALMLAFIGYKLLFAALLVILHFSK